MIKVGFDEVILKMYAMNHSAWEMDKVKLIGKKTEVKGIMYAIRQDEATGQAGNKIPEELMAQFQASRREGFEDSI